MKCYFINHSNAKRWKILVFLCLPIPRVTQQSLTCLGRRIRPFRRGTAGKWQQRASLAADQRAHAAEESRHSRVCVEYCASRRLSQAYSLPGRDAPSGRYQPPYSVDEPSAQHFESVYSRVETQHRQDAARASRLCSLYMWPECAGLISFIQTC